MKKNMIFLILAGSLPLGLTACSTLKARVPFARIQTPEVKSENYQTSINLVSLSNSATYTVSDDASARPFVEKHLDSFDSQKLSTVAGGDIQLFNRFEIGVDIGAFTDIRAKYQFLGETLGHSTPGNQSLTGFFSYATAVESESGDQNGQFGPGGFNWSGSVRGTTKSIGLSYGYRLTEEVLLFTGISAGAVNTEGQVTHDLSNNGTSPETVYNLDKKMGTTQTVGAGLQFGREDWQVLVAANYSQMDLDSVKTSAMYGSAQLTYLFGGTSSSDSVSHATNSDGVSDKDSNGDSKLNGAQGQSSFREEATKSTWQGRDFLALASSYLVGFGLGQAVQNRWSESGKNFAIADAAGVVLFFAGAQQCLYECRRSNRSLEAGSTLAVSMSILAISRIWQFVDVIVDASSPVIRRSSYLMLAPDQDGGRVLYSYDF